MPYLIGDLKVGKNSHVRFSIFCAAFRHSLITILGLQYDPLCLKMSTFFIKHDSKCNILHKYMLRLMYEISDLMK